MLRWRFNKAVLITELSPMNLTCGLLFCLLAAQTGERVDAQPAREFRVARELDVELDGRISATWHGIGLRQALRQVSRDRNIAILLDRRVDPMQELSINIEDHSLRGCLERMAQHVNAAVAIAGNTVCIGPVESTAKLRTLIRLRAGELADDSTGIPKRRQFDLLREHTLRWEDFTRPADLLRQVTEQYDLSIEGLELVPHDLWAQGTLPRVDACALLSLILIQFDLTFEWIDNGGGIRLVPVPDVVVVEGRYRPRGMTADAAVALLNREMPGVFVQVAGQNVLVRGTVERLEEAAAIIRPAATRPRRAVRSTSLPLRFRQFTIRRQRVRFSTLLKSLEQKGVEFEYDAGRLAAAGVDLNRLIEIEANRASADELLQMMCDPVGLSFAVDGVKVTLTPK